MFKNKALKGILNAPWYTRNIDIHRDLKINTVAEEKRIQAEAHYKMFNEHMNRRRKIST